MKTYWTSCAAALAIAVAATPASAEMLVGIGPSNTLVFFDSASPAISTTKTITGLAGGEVLTGIDLRPANRTLYTLATSGNLYSLTRSGSGYSANLVGNLATAGGMPVAIAGGAWGLDFNPVPDRLRFVSNTDQNLRINPNNGVTIIDGTISAPGNEQLVGSAYTNSFAGATTTTLYGLDAVGDRLLRSDNPNAGTYLDVGALVGIDLAAGDNTVGFDISGITGLAILSDVNSIYSINLANAQTSFLGRVTGGPLGGLTFAAVPEPSTWAMLIGGFGMVGGAMRRRSRVAVAFA